MTLVRGVQTWGTPKGHERREVPIPRFLVDELARTSPASSATSWSSPATKGGALRAQVFQRSVLTAAAERSISPACTRTSYATPQRSLAIASGATIKVVQQMLGHKSATMTLDLYGHLYADQLDELADRCTTPRQPLGRSRGPPCGLFAD